jgi:hypothetical protein
MGLRQKKSSRLKRQKDKKEKKKEKERERKKDGFELKLFV